MPLPTLNLYSEPYSPSGNVAADGVKKLLGAPRLDLLQTLVREAVQNSCDAAKSGTGPRVLFRLRQLTPDQVAAMADALLPQLPAHGETAEPISRFLSDRSPWVLEICDFGTTGLAGPTRADTPTDDDEYTDFVDFIRNIGSKRNTDLGGGTYGYGKSALYLASNCGLIVVDSETSSMGHPVRRLIAAQLGEAHDAQSGGRTRRYTGRHWWGRLDESGDFVDPVEEDEAVALATALGLPERARGETGTTIMILAPQFLDENVDDVVGALKEALLWYFWPRLMRDAPVERCLHAGIELNGVPHPIPPPEDTPPLDLFCEAMREIRTGGERVQRIQSQKPAAFLGHLSIVKGFKGERIPLRQTGEPLFPETCRHIAVMRPVELVVRYFDDGDPLPQPGMEWAGVFVTSSEPEVEKAFADSEPPAHDDWQPDMLPSRSRARSFVRGALKRIKDAAREVSGGQLTSRSGQRDGPSLAHIADLFGRALGSANRQGGGPRTRGGGGGGAGNRRPFAATRPAFIRLTELAGQPVAIFRTDVRNDSGSDLVLQLAPSLVIDGGAAGSELGGYDMPVVVQVCDSAGSVIGTGRRIELRRHTGPVEIALSLPTEGAVTVKATIEGPEA